MKTCLSLPILTLFGITPAIAAENFTCTVDRIPIRYEVSGEKLLGYENDLSGLPNTFDVLENTEKGIIATRHDPYRLVWITIDRKNGKFLEKLEWISGTYEETYSGICEQR
jgi:hypothetical protein